MLFLSIYTHIIERLVFSDVEENHEKMNKKERKIVILHVVVRVITND